MAYHYVGIINNAPINNSGSNGTILVNNGDITGELGDISLTSGSYSFLNGELSGVATLMGIVGDYEAVSGIDGSTPHTNGTAYGYSNAGAWAAFFGQ